MSSAYICRVSSILVFVIGLPTPAQWIADEDPEAFRATPTEYGPVFQETGFRPGGNFELAGFQAVVNPYGGNLIITQDDLSIPGTGGYSLYFSRSYNSGNAYDPFAGVVRSEYDGPLGIGWTCHYGFLIDSGIEGKVWIDGSGARELFYSHRPSLTANPDIPILGDGGESWISGKMNILARDGSGYLLYRPSGLTLTLASDVETTLFKPTRIEDVHGNSWTLSYEIDSDTTYFISNLNGTFHHPLVKELRDNWGRILRLRYTSGRRLTSVELNGATKARFTHTTSNGYTYLRTHKTALNRTTTYTTQTNATGRGTVKSVNLPTGGTMNFTYAKKRFFYQTGLITEVYACTSYSWAGATWNYNYPTESGSSGEFVVTVAGPEGYSAEHRFYSYALTGLCNTELWRVGSLVRKRESRGGVNSIIEYEYQPYQISDQRVVGLCSAEPFQIPLTREVKQKIGGGPWKTTTNTYSSNDFTLPTRVTSPGFTTDMDYVHRTSTSAFMLGLATSNIVKVGSSVVEKTISNYGSGVLPNWIDFYRTSSNKIRTTFTYWTGNAKAGALRTKTFNGYSESYNYANGVLSSINYPSGKPDLSRNINSDGTVRSETKGGVTHNFTYDADFRVRSISLPADNDVVISYNDTARTVTKTQGPARFKETYNSWGQLTGVDETIQGGLEARRTYGYNALDQVVSETTPMGANYTLSYDVTGRLLSRNATNAADDISYSYQTFADGSMTTTSTLNNSLTQVVKHDALGRILQGSRQGHTMNYSYSATTQTITSLGHATRTITYDYFGNKVSENHPETGTINYSYNNRGWLTSIQKPGGTFSFGLDGNGRPTSMSLNGSTVITQGYHPSYDMTDSSNHGGVIVQKSNFDSQGRPRTLQITIPEALAGPALLWPLGFQLMADLQADPRFHWNAVTGAARYRFEVRVGASRYSLETTATQALFSQLTGFALTTATTYQWRVRGEKSGGEVGPWSPWAEFETGSPVLAVSTTVLDAATGTGNNPDDQIFLIDNTGNDLLTFTVADNRTWMTVTPTGGSVDSVPATITVSFEASSLSPGTYTGQIDIASNGGNATIAVTLTVTDQPMVCLSESQLIINAELGQNPTPASFQVRNCGSGTLNYTLSDNVPWLSLSPTSGTSSGEWDTIQVNFTTSSLTEGTYLAEISVNGGEAVLPLTLTVAEIPVLYFEPATIQIDIAQGTNASQQNLTIRNDGSGTLDYTLSESSTWLLLSTTSGSSSGENDIIQVIFSTVGLAEGSYNESILIQSDGGNGVVDVSLTVHPPPRVEVLPNMLQPMVGVGQNAASQTFEVRNAGFGTLSYSISENSPWLSVSPTAGTVGATPQTITVSYQTASLSPGTYQRTITVTGAGTSATVAVTLTVNSEPLVCLSESQLNINAELGQNPGPASFQVRNCGSGTLNYTLTDNVPWLSLSPTSGMSSGEWDTIQVNFTTSSLAEGTYLAEISVNGGEAVLPLTLTVAEIPVLYFEPATIQIDIAQGTNASQQNLTIRNDGSGTLDYTLSESITWLLLSTTSGSSSGENDIIQVIFSTVGLAEGSYNESILIQSDGGNGVVDVSLTVHPPPRVEVLPDMLQPMIGVGQNASSQTFEVRNAGFGTLSYSISDNTSWLSVSPITGTLGATPQTITVSYQTASLSPGTYQGIITVTGAGTSATVAVTLTVTSEPMICVVPSSFDAVVREGANPPSQTLTVTNCGTGTLAYTVNDDAPWLTVSPTSGSSTGNPVNHGVNIASAGLVPGTYNALIRVTSGILSENIPFTLTVNDVIEFPDANLEAYLVSQFDTDGDGGISLAEAAVVTAIDCANLNIADISGLELFTVLTYLDASQNRLTDMQPIWDNPNLTQDPDCSHYIDISENALNTSPGQGYCWLHCLPIGFVNTADQSGSANPIFCRCEHQTCSGPR